MTDRRTVGLDAVLAVRTPIDDREAAAIARVRDALGELTHPFDAAEHATHVTASAIVTGGRGVLLHYHKRLARWLQPGGHVEADEEPSQAALREVAEETGIDARHPFGGPRVCHVDVHDGPFGHLHLDVRYLLHADADPVPPSGESQGVGWFGWAEARRLVDARLAAALSSVEPPAGRRDGDGDRYR